MSSTLTEYLNSQDQLVREAALALPHQFSQCTYSLGPLRQAVYLCLTCPEARGLCSACSVACHTDHEQVELFPKRNFRCDCPTAAIAHQCTLYTKLEEANTRNQYGQNFNALFCRCGRPYDPNVETETMIQCLACEDWFHESCCNLRERPSDILAEEVGGTEDRPPHTEDAPSSKPNQQPANERSPDAPDALPSEQPGHAGSDDADDAASEASSSGLPPPLISGDEYESLVCGSCVLRNPTLRRWAGSSGAIMVVRDAPGEPWRRLDGEAQFTTTRAKPKDPDAEAPDVEIDFAESNSDPAVEESEAKSGLKRPSSSLDVDGECPDAKRARGGDSQSDAKATSTLSAPCLAPPQPPLARQIIQNLQNAGSEGFSSQPLGAGDVFFTLNFRERWCRCSSCLPPLQAEPWLLEDEETYEPPEDPDSGLSLEELGMRALERIPRDRAIDGIHAFNEMRDDLVKFLRPFAQDGKIVGEADVRSFFEQRREAAAAKATR